MLNFFMFFWSVNNYSPHCSMFSGCSRFCNRINPFGDFNFLFHRYCFDAAKVAVHGLLQLCKKICGVCPQVGICQTYRKMHTSECRICGYLPFQKFSLRKASYFLCLLINDAKISNNAIPRKHFFK